MRNLNIIHQNFESFPKATYVFENPSLESIATICVLMMQNVVVDEPIKFTLNFGMAKCSPKDQYCRKTGRELAIQRMKQTQFSLFKCLLQDEFIILTFKLENHYFRLKFNKITLQTRIYG